jgi:hypothetical protein
MEASTPQIAVLARAAIAKKRLHRFPLQAAIISLGHPHIFYSLSTCGMLVLLLVDTRFRTGTATALFEHLNNRPVVK